MKVSLGLLEVKGLALAINTADAMAKCAAINMVGIDTAKGGGWMTIKVTGDVAAVQAAVATGAALAEQGNGFVAQKVLSRPDAKLLASVVPVEKPEPAPQDDAPQEQEPEEEKPEPEPEKQEPETESEEADLEEVALEEDKEDSPEETAPEDNAPVETEPQQDAETVEEQRVATCNLCQDPACPRKKGEPHVDCIHEGKKR
ncbi:BMC domain-containing protein [Vibrio sp. HN007]|uniref:BMC domain-containing protein n=1 Tax=Vibrio iocasae TaxID=3098914 RepID=UPI0035D4D046